MKNGLLTVDQISVDPDRVGLFVLSVPNCISPEQSERIRGAWDSAWRQAGRENPPAALILPEDFHIAALADADLKRLGLMRLPHVAETGATMDTE